MRAACERCEQLQPVDWAPGDLCIHCGESVRHEVRCGWCTSWTPFAAYCRTCGAEVVTEEMFGAARMLKDAGVDRFSIAERLSEMDPAQVENFTRIYHGHAIVVARHVEQLAFLQRWLRHQHWAANLEDQLVSELPWAPDRLTMMSSPTIELSARIPSEQAAIAAQIEAATPIDSTRELAAIVRLRLDDWPSFTAACAAFESSDPTIRHEAALALTSWRVRLACGPFDGGPELLAELRSSKFVPEASVRLAQLTAADTMIPPEARTAPDIETSFGAALVSGDVQRLEAALRGDDLERCAAGAALIRLGVTDRIATALVDGPDAVRASLLHELANVRRPFPDLTHVLVDIVESTTDDGIRELATRVACPTISTGDALRIARTCQGDRHILQSLLQRSELPPDGLASLVDQMIETGSFSASQYGISTIAENGRLADTFVPTRFHDSSPAVRTELLALSELQLQQRSDVDLHRFVLGVVFGETSGDLRTTAWWVLHRWYRSTGEYRGEGPFRLNHAEVTRFFGSIDVFLPRLTDVIRDKVALEESTFADFVANLLSTADPAFIADIQSRDHDGRELVDALIETIQSCGRFNAVESMMDLLSHLGTHVPWRADALRGLKQIDHSGNYHFAEAVRRLEVEPSAKKAEEIL